MRAGLRILVIVPARGGSKGVPRKNLRPVGGVPLVARVGHLVRELPWVDRAVVSTDDDEIAAVASAAGLDAPFRRPEALSGDRVGDVEVLVHALESCEKADGTVYDVVVMLQPTCPLSRAEHVSATVDELARGAFDAVWTISPTDLKYHPRKQLVLEDRGTTGGTTSGTTGGTTGDAAAARGTDQAGTDRAGTGGAEKKLAFYDPEGGNVIARQQLSPVYHRNGAAYAIARSCLLSKHSLLGENASAVILDEPLVSIDTLEDFAAVEAALSARDEPAA